MKDSLLVRGLVIKLACRRSAIFLFGLHAVRAAREERRSKRALSRHDMKGNVRWQIQETPVTLQLKPDMKGANCR